MTDYLEGADGYFAMHLEQGVWASLTAAQKNAALTGAVNDLTDYLGEALPDLNESPARAVYEQALFLVKRGRNKPAVVAESVEGVGSRSYQLPAEPDEREAVCVRARRILAPLLFRNMRKISRG